MAESSKDQPKQSNSTKKTTGSKDAKALAHNKNRTLEAPDMPDLTREKGIMTVARGFKGPGRSYSQRVREKVVKLAGKGMTLMEIQGIRGMPRACTIGLWKKDDPDFAEEMEQAFSDYVDEVAKRTVPKLEQALELRGFHESILDQAEKLVPTMTKTADGTEVPITENDPAWRKGLYDKLMVNLLHAEKKGRTLASTAGVILSYAERRAQYWRRDTEGAANMVVIDMNLDMDKKTDLPGSTTGQNAAALLAMRNVTP